MFEQIQLLITTNIVKIWNGKSPITNVEFKFQLFTKINRTVNKFYVPKPVKFRTYITTRITTCIKTQFQR